MKIKQTKEKLKKWWNEHKQTVKVGAVCLVAGSLCGFVKGVDTMCDMIVKCVPRENQLEDNNSTNSEANVDEPNQNE